MNQNASEIATTAAVVIDALLQDSYLLVVELRKGALVLDGPTLSALCSKQIEHVRQELQDAGLSQRSIDHISHAQCALLDETVLNCAQKDAREFWASEPLQAKFFNRHQAGEFLYEDMREALREPAPDLHVLTAYQRVLVLGFQGRYSDVKDPDREQLLAALNKQVAPLALGHGVATQPGSGQQLSDLRWLRTPSAHVVTAGLLLVGAWWGLDRLLGGVIATLLSAQV
ncbi:type VI secretion system protein TssL, short form [Pseudomonas akapageensis]|uniref:type VI secretion system protein TssL, short form n=1 Tax=Pseudomonas akapageensis TaxID=2609961 RepID=UPI00140D3058|nr:type VI secretion system protein TssL, short form [Pseudomonas akapageensis]